MKVAEGSTEKVQIDAPDLDAILGPAKKGAAERLSRQGVQRALDSDLIALGLAEIEKRLRDLCLRRTRGAPSPARARLTNLKAKTELGS